LSTLRITSNLLDNEMIIRQANKKDLNQLVTLEKDFLIATQKMLKPEFKLFDEATSKSEFLKKIKDNDCLILVAEKKKKIIAFSVNEIKKAQLNKRFINEGKISGIFVSKYYRKRGISSLLLKDSIKWFKSKRCIYLQLNVFKNNPAKDIYKKWGFDEFSIQMKKSL